VLLLQHERVGKAIPIVDFVGEGQARGKNISFKLIQIDIFVFRGVSDEQRLSEGAPGGLENQFLAVSSQVCGLRFYL